MKKALTREVKEYAKELGIDLIGIVPAKVIDDLPPLWVGWKIRSYTKKTTDFLSDVKSVIVLGYHVWDDICEVALRRGDEWVYPGFLPLSCKTRDMAFFLEDKGYSTYRGYPLISYKMAAQLAGLGVYGKNSLIVTPQFGPWVRFTVLLTTASLEEDLPAKEDLCGKCAKCIKACPLGALTPYKVDPDRCLVGIHLNDKVNEKLKELIDKYEPSLTSQSHLMCTACQKVCKIGTRGLK